MIERPKMTNGFGLAFAYWSALALAILAAVLPLILFSLTMEHLLAIKERSLLPRPSIWGILSPYLLAAIPWLCLDILGRDRHGPAVQRSRLFLAPPHGFKPAHLIIWGRWLVGCVSLVTVGRITLRR